MIKSYFTISASKYVTGKDFDILRPASLNNPKDNSVMFITDSHIEMMNRLLEVKECLVFWPESVAVPEKTELRHAVYRCSEPHTQYCRFFKENCIANLPKIEKFSVVNGAYIADIATIGEGTTILPGAYIGGDCVIGNGCYIGAGAKLVGEITIGNNVVIRENTVIGADGLTTDRESNGEAVTMPQFGGVVIEDNVQIGANSVIARGAIDDTIIGKGSKIDNQSFISHNVVIGKDTFIVGETIMFGSSSVGDRCLISGNCTLANYVSVGNDSVLGMSATALKSIPDNVVAFGSPINTIKERK